MTNSSIKRLVFFTLIFLNFFTKKSLFAQNLTLTQDSKFEKLLNEKRKINSSLNVDNRYKIQIFKGNDEESKKHYLDFKKSYPEYDATIVFFTPEYRVYVGNYKSRIEATRNFEILKKSYPKALLIKPSN